MNTPPCASAQPLILVLEDELLIRLVVCETLSQAGYDVVEAEHANEALAHLRARASEVSALFTDVHVPGSMDGLALAHLSRRTWPWIALLIASGRARPTADALPQGGRFLPKPYEPEHVVSHLRELLDCCSGPVRRPG